MTLMGTLWLCLRVTDHLEKNKDGAKLGKPPSEFLFRVLQETLKTAPAVGIAPCRLTESNK